MAAAFLTYTDGSTTIGPTYFCSDSEWTNLSMWVIQQGSQANPALYALVTSTVVTDTTRFANEIYNILKDQPAGAPGGVFFTLGRLNAITGEGSATESVSVSLGGN